MVYKKPFQYFYSYVLQALWPSGYFLHIIRKDSDYFHANIVF